MPYDDGSGDDNDSIAMVSIGLKYCFGRQK